jgi:SAM-dependent methyltransferase
MKIDYSYHYRKWHADTPEHAARVVSYYEQILKPELGNQRKTDVLDVGCGMGYLIMALQKMGFENVSGIDTDQGQVAACRAKNLNVVHCEDSVQYLHQRASSFDMITAFDVIEHIPHEHQLPFVSALCTALRPGGMFICTVPNANSAVGFRYRHIDWTHHSSFTEHSLDFLLHCGGFTEIKIRPFELSERPRFWFLPFGAGRFWLAFRFFRLFRRLEMMVELGPQAGREVPLSLNILASCVKPYQVK